jgi:glycosyltransferase involved in cell wall biosynthesis
VGNGEEYENAKSKISEYKLDNNVVLHGYKNKAEIEEILVDTSLGINASYSESFGLAVLETLNYGIPCIAFDSAVGLADIIDNEKNGYIIKNRNKEEMAKKIVELFEDKNKLKELGNSAREKSLKFSEENIKSKWKELVEH